MQHATWFADVIVPLSVPNKYTYRVPRELNGQMLEGQRVLVQFGKTKVYTGIVYRLHQTAPDYTVKYIDAVLDDAPVVTDKQLRFWDWLAYYYCAAPGEVMNAALPSGLKLSSTSHVQLNPDFDFESSSPTQFTEREHLLLDALHATPQLDFEAVSAVLGIKSVHPIVNNLIRKKALVVVEEVKDKYRPKLESYLRLSPALHDEHTLHTTLDALEKKAFRQAEALLYFLHLSRSGATQGWIKKAQVLKGCDAAAITALLKKNLLEQREVETGRLQFETNSQTAQKTLSSAQASAYTQVTEGLATGQPVLLHGVTGSGKTEVYIQLIRDALNAGKQVLYLIPEIALTTQLISRLRAVFGEVVGVYHSRFSENERVEIWNNVLHGAKTNSPGEAPIGEGASGNGKAYRILLGARSSLFLPFTNLGLIIIDEEHDSSFKQHDPAPRYHARDAALYLATLHNAQVVMGSATPSVESWHHAQTGKYTLATLPGQYVSSGGTSLEICDTRYYEQTNQMRASLSPPLFEAVQTALREKKQVILFQNRRGFAPYTECRQCGHVPQCVQCDVSLIYHKNQQKLVCHYCGYSLAPPKVCPACGSNQLHYKGMGTEKIEEDVELLFPGAKIARMDLDSTRSKYAHKQLIDDFENGGIDILIGTQMVTKGLDFDNVSVVGVLQADASFNFPDFRSFERSFQLISQVRGRAGRHRDKGRVFIQTSQPEHPVLRYIMENRTADFYTDTLAERQQYFYPPFSRLIELTVMSKDLNEVNHLSAELFALLKPSFGEYLLGPEFPLVSRIKNFYHKQLLIKVERQAAPQQVRQHLYNAINALQNNHQNWRYRVMINVDPA